MAQEHPTSRRPPPALLRAASLAALVALAWGCGASQGEERDGRTSASGSEGSAAMAQETPSASQERLPPRGEAWVIFGADTVRAEVARTPEERERGLMYREELTPGRGMLFVFPNTQVRSFWMRNTLIALDIAYLDETLTVVDIQGMQPQTEDLHESARPAMFALEVPLGWFGEQGIEVGAVARVVFGPG